jgi:hypothetical protein
MRRLYWTVGLLTASLALSPPTYPQPEESGAAPNEARVEVLRILRKLEVVGPFHCVEVMTTTSSRPGETHQSATVTTKVWQKGPYWRQEGVEPAASLTINRPEGFFLYQNETKTFIQPPDFAKEEMLRTFKLPPNQSTGVERIWSDVLDSPDLKILGEDVVDGKQATLISYSTSPFGVGREEIKLWLWNETGLTLRREKTVYLNEAVVGTERMEWKEFVFEDIPNSLFDVPQEHIQKLPEDWHP